MSHIVTNLIKEQVKINVYNLVNQLSDASIKLS